MNNSRRLVLVCSSLEAGGAERVLSELANAWSASGHSVTLVTTYSMEKGPDFYPLDSRVRRVRLVDASLRGASSGGRWRRLFVLRRLLKDLQPEIVLAFMDKTAVATLIATRGLRIPVIACERTDPTRQVIGHLWSLLRRVLYPRAAAVAVQTWRVKEKFERVIPGMKLHVVPNPIPFALASRDPVEKMDNNDRPRLMSLGRLGAEKGFDLLIEAFSRIAGQFPKWDLWIWGEGAERRKLEGQVAAANLEERVFFPGQTNAPWDEISRAEIFVLPSRYEGMPNAMLEAMAIGRAVVAFDCASGPREISRDGKDAVLVPAENVGALAAALERLMSDEGERRRLGKAALSVRERYAMNRVLEAWDGVLSGVIAMRGVSSRIL